MFDTLVCCFLIRRVEDKVFLSVFLVYNKAFVLLVAVSCICLLDKTPLGI